MKANMLKNPIFIRVSPFIAFMGFIALEQSLQALARRQIIDVDSLTIQWLYLPKAAFVGLLLLVFCKSYQEINLKDLFDHKKTAVSIFSGMLVFLLWINMDWTLGSQNTPPGFNPAFIQGEELRWLMLVVRIAGAVIIVPIMEEIFWRSFLLRYLINSDFTSVTIGRFSLFSFVSVSILFGLEHHYLFAGIMAGVVFNGIYYHTKSIAHCILSHAIANLCLAAYVLNTAEWRFW